MRWSRPVNTSGCGSRSVSAPSATAQALDRDGEGQGVIHGERRAGVDEFGGETSPAGHSAGPPSGPGAGCRAATWRPWSGRRHRGRGRDARHARRSARWQPRPPRRGHGRRERSRELPIPRIQAIRGYQDPTSSMSSARMTSSLSASRQATGFPRCLAYTTAMSWVSIKCTCPSLSKAGSKPRAGTAPGNLNSQALLAGFGEVHAEIACRGQKFDWQADVRGSPGSLGSGRSRHNSHPWCTGGRL